LTDLVPDSSEGALEKPSGEGLLGGVMNAVKIYIREHGLQVGDELPSEGTFAEQVGVSRTIVREAYRSLAALTLIDIGNGRRARVAAPKADVLALITDHAVHTERSSRFSMFDVQSSAEPWHSQRYGGATRRRRRSSVLSTRCSSTLPIRRR
jgi:GntR family transcriptional repressor for pyruvate dehydrogenase complex